ncbi:MAG: ribonuclease III [Bradyrhizobiaceae bacterium]|nr:ribonuclease III [Bradyrhizobiaceae bacterium]
MVGTLEPAFHDREMSRRTAAGRRELEARIGYEFADKSLLERALTHISALSGKSRTSSYQRLEFLGDHVLGLIVSDMLFRAFPKADEGELSRRLADLVRKEACADVAREIDLGLAIRLGASEANAGGRQRTAILADVCEALIGAVFLDGGYAAGADIVERLWGERLRTPARPLRDPKTVLQEWAQARGLPTPSYREISRSGPHHDPEFVVAVNLPEFSPAEGVGRSKRAAEQAAAAAMLSREGVQDGADQQDKEERKEKNQGRIREKVKEKIHDSATAAATREAGSEVGAMPRVKARARNRGADEGSSDGDGVDSVKAAAAT